MAGTPQKAIFALANMINNNKQYKKMKRTILRRAFALALFATICFTLFAAEEAWLWPIEGQKAGDGILYRPQDNIEKELNFDGLFIAAPEGTNVLCPADAVVTSCDYTYYTSLTNSVGWGSDDKTYDEFIAEQKEYFRRKGWDIRYLTLTVGLKIGVTVLPDKIREHGDTLSYNVGSYTQQGDRVIGDVLKRMPGIEVSESGAIKFNGKSIKNFYVEDMDLLQGRYGLATNNINAADVTTVQVLQNHQPIKALQGKELSDGVAINRTAEPTTP